MGRKHFKRNSQPFTWYCHGCKKDKPCVVIKEGKAYCQNCKDYKLTNKRNAK